MNITLTPDTEAYLRDLVSAGKFPSADDVVSEALRRMREHDQKLDELRRAIAVGIAQADQGLTAQFNEATLARIKAAARRSRL